LDFLRFIKCEEEFIYIFKKSSLLEDCGEGMGLTPSKPIIPAVSNPFFYADEDGKILLF